MKKMVLLLLALAGCFDNSDGSADVASPAGSDFQILTVTPEGTWVSGLAANALVGGIDNNAMSLYVCNAEYGGELVPGKIRSDWSGCDFSVDDVEQTIAPFSTLTPTWVSESNGLVPTNAAYFGSDSSGPLATCRGTLGGIVYTGKIGKMGTGYTGCHIGWNNAEYVVASYDVMVNAGPTGVGNLPVTTTARTGQPPPYNAVVGAVTFGTIVYPCLGKYLGATVPGWIDPGMDSCAISSGGHEEFTTAYSVLEPEFVAVSSPLTPFVTGSDAYGNPMYTCNATYASGIQLGYVDSSGYCTFGYGGRGVTLTSGFNVLGVP
jgi:hypothetical protein